MVLVLQPLQLGSPGAATLNAGSPGSGRESLGQGDTPSWCDHRSPAGSSLLSSHPAPPSGPRVPVPSLLHRLDPRWKGQAVPGEQGPRPSPSLSLPLWVRALSLRKLLSTVGPPLKKALTPQRSLQAVSKGHRHLGAQPGSARPVQPLTAHAAVSAGPQPRYRACSPPQAGRSDPSVSPPSSPFRGCP